MWFLSSSIIYLGKCNLCQVACPFRWNGCKHVAKLEYLNTHKRDCQFNPDNMPDFLRDHMKENKNSPPGPPEHIGNLYELTSNYV